MSQVKKKVAFKIRMEVNGGALRPSDKGVGPSLGGKLANIKDFCDQFSAQTKDETGAKVRVVVKAFADKSFDFEIKGNPTAYLLQRKANITSGSGQPNKKKVGTISLDSLKEIAKKQMKYMNAFKEESAISMVIGTAKRMGIEVV